MRNCPGIVTSFQGSIEQTYKINTFDPAVCMKALPLVWSHPDKYQKHIIVPGHFTQKWTTLACLLIIRHKAPGMQRYYWKLGWQKKVVWGILFLEKHLLKPLLDTILTCNRQCVDSALNDESTNHLIQMYAEFQEQVCQGHLGKTGRLWISFMDKEKLVFMLNFAVKTNTWKLFHKCNGEMADLFFAYMVKTTAG